MKTNLIKSTLGTAITLILTACGDSGGVAGIGGSGYISSGSVTGFGSVFVNGVEFETDSASFDVDGSSGNQGDLGIGMIVQVNGSINPDGITGTATSITFDDQLQGPVSNLTAFSADIVTRTFTVLGVTVIIDSSSTIFDISSENGIPPATVFNFETISNGNNVEISAFPNSNGDLVATRIELKDIAFDPSNIVEIRGIISGLVNTRFTLNGITINADSAVITDLPNGLVEGQLVELKGTYDIASNTITASSVEGEDDAVDDTDEIEVEGIIIDYVSDSNFIINGINVDASNAIFEPLTLVLANDVRVEVEGAIVNAVLVADEVKVRAGKAKVNAKVGSVNTVAGTFEVIPVVGEPSITVTATNITSMEDEVNDIEPFTLNNLVINDFTEISGYVDDSGSITANEIRVRNPDDVIVQGIIESGATAGTVKVYGVEFTIADPGETKFQNISDVIITQVEFNGLVVLDSTLIKVRDRDDNGIADDIEIESP